MIVLLNLQFEVWNNDLIAHAISILIGSYESSNLSNIDG